MTTKPMNILLITSDQHRADAMGCAGHPCVRTPHLDKLAQQGVRFDRAYSDCPVCIPSRTTMVTGIKAHTYGMPAFAAEYRIDRPKELFLGSLMTKAQYQTQIVGKTHWHTEPSFRGGFEGVLSEGRYREEIMERTISNRSDPTGMGMNELFPDMNPLPPEMNMTNWVVDHCLKFLRYRDRTQPFFLWASFVAPHPPNTIHEPYYSMYDHDPIPESTVPDWLFEERCPYELFRHRTVWNSVRMTPSELRKAKGVYYSMVTHMDHQLGRLLGKLRSERVLDHTLIVYASDHGEMLGDHLDMGKSTFLEHSANVPLLICPPSSMGVEPGTVHDAVIGLDDLLPTFCEVAGMEPPGDITGKSILPLLQGKVSGLHEEYHGQLENSHMFLYGPYKYMYFADDGKELLFDASKDRLDQYPLNKDTELLARIRSRFVAHLALEGHAHVNGNGGLVNLRTPQLPENRLKAQNVYGWH